MVDRLFVFGDSCTLHMWPSWANIYCDVINPNEFRNFAIPGIGNVGILAEIVSADITYNFTENDEIAVCWSTWLREDRYYEDELPNNSPLPQLQNGWLAEGSVYNSTYYDKNFIMKYVSEPNDIVKNNTAIIAANKGYEIKFNFCYEGPESKVLEPKDKYLELRNFYSRHIKNDGILKLNEYDDRYRGDIHPTIQDHYQMLNQVIKIPTPIVEKYDYLHKSYKQSSTGYSDKNWIEWCKSTYALHDKRINDKVGIPIWSKEIA